MTPKEKAKQLAEECTCWSKLMTKYAGKDQLSDGQIKVIEDRWNVLQEAKTFLVTTKGHYTRAPSGDLGRTLKGVYIRTLKAWEVQGYNAKEYYAFLIVDGALVFRNSSVKMKTSKSTHEVKRSVLFFPDPIKFAGQSFRRVRTLTQSKGR